MTIELDWKITRDAFYADLFERYGLAYIQEIGFFFDTHAQLINLDDTLNVLCTPLGFNNPQRESQKDCVLLTTGSFCPIHDGHIEIMDKAKHTLENQGWNVLGGYLSPGHDEYVSGKCKESFIPITHRILYIQKAIADIPWLSIDPWEGVFNQVAINFTDVITRLKAYLALHLRQNIPVFYICGSDNARFAASFEIHGHCVVVNRPGYESEFTRYKSLSNERILFIAGDNNASSSAIRSNSNPVNLLQKDLHLRTNNHPLEKKLTEILAPYFASINEANIRQQKRTFVEENIKSIISLDANTHAQFNLHISREFDIFGIGGLEYKTRAGNISLDDQCTQIPKGEYTLFDSDIHTGGTIHFVRDFLQNRGYRILGAKAFINNNKCEILDASDFFISEVSTGLTIRLTCNKSFCAPYVFPYVDPFIRCSIENPMAFSIEVWKMNMDYLSKKSSNVASSNNRALFEYIGFNSEDSLYDVCKWHYEMLISYQSVDPHFSTLPAK
ncbi:MAG: hypothetical protein V4732_10905 [Pseudomonadota bacterium]